MDSRMDKMFSNADEWDELERQAIRQYMSDVEILTLDGNGRLLVPRRYLDAADITSTVRFIGMNDTIELWNPANVEGPQLPQELFAEKLKQIMGRSKQPT